MRLNLFSLLALLGCAYVGIAQTEQTRFLPDAPSHEVYDLMCDHKGYLWLAHDQGISRFDGSRFLNLHHPQQNSLSMSGLVGDTRGRVWCHNFNGQIFYVDSLRLHLVTQYEFQKELAYPRITISGKELIATSNRGVFALDIDRFTHRYLSVAGGTSSLTNLGDKVLLYGSGGWSVYESGRGVRTVSGPKLATDEVVSLQPHPLGDTAFLISNPEGVYYKLVLRNDEVQVISREKAGGFINTVSVSNGEAWVHTKKGSFTTRRDKSISDANLSTLIYGHQNYQWVGSLRQGLGVRYNQVFCPMNIDLPALLKITTVRAWQDQLLVGANDGSIYLTAKEGRPIRTWQLPSAAGAIENICPLERDKVLIGASLGIYLLDLNSKDLELIDQKLVVKEILPHGSQILLAATTGIFSLPRDKPRQIEPWHLKSVRCRSLAVAEKQVYAAYSDGVFRIDQGKENPLFFNGQPIYAATMQGTPNGLLIGTYTQGLLAYSNGRMRQLTTNGGLAENSVRKIIPGSNGHFWLVFGNRIQSIDPDSLTIVRLTVPISQGQIEYLQEVDGQLLVNTSNGLYLTKAIAPLTASGLRTYIDNIIVNGKDTLWNHNFLSGQNTFAFAVSTPLYTHEHQLFYRYRLSTRKDSMWHTVPNDFDFTFFALEPGKYRFEVQAVDETGQPLAIGTAWDFEISPYWYKSNLFKAVLLSVILLALFSVVRLYFIRRLQHQKAAYERLLAVQQERQRISAEMHDDIGASLSGIRLLTEMTGQKLGSPEAQHGLHRIHHSLNDITDRMKEVIWSLNPDNDNVDNLAAYLHQQAVNLFENSTIRLQVRLPRESPPLDLEGEARRHIYLAVKEALHNVLKHSHATLCELSIVFSYRQLCIQVTDNGRGVQESNGLGNGLRNMKKRMKAVRGTCELQSNASGTTIKFTITF